MITPSKIDLFWNYYCKNCYWSIYKWQWYVRHKKWVNWIIPLIEKRELPDLRYNVKWLGREFCVFFHYKGHYKWKIKFYEHLVCNTYTHQIGKMVVMFEK